MWSICQVSLRYVTALIIDHCAIFGDLTSSFLSGPSIGARAPCKRTWQAKEQAGCSLTLPAQIIMTTLIQSERCAILVSSIAALVGTTLLHRQTGAHACSKSDTFAADPAQPCCQWQLHRLIDQSVYGRFAGAEWQQFAVAVVTMDTLNS